MFRNAMILSVLVPLAGCGLIGEIFGQGETTASVSGYARQSSGPAPAQPGVQPAGAQSQPRPAAQPQRAAQPPPARQTAARAECEGGFTLGRQAMIDSRAGLGHECNGARSNCVDGYFLELDGGGCYCVMSCSTLIDDRIGASCSEDGTWTCQHVQATNASANHARICAAQSWNLCQRGS